MLRNDGLLVDYDERAGFLVGKAATVADRDHRRDEREFAVLVSRLRVRKWAMDNREHVRKYRRERARLPELKAKADAQRTKRQAKRRAKWKPDRTTLVCLHCGTCWCRVIDRNAKRGPGPAPKFCTEAHAKAHYRAQRKLDPAYLAAERTRAMRHAGRPDADIAARAVVWAEEARLAAVARAEAAAQAEAVAREAIAQAKRERLANLALSNAVRNVGRRAAYKASRGPHLRRGQKPIDLVGQRFGLLTVAEDVTPLGQRGARRWLARCDCGGTRVSRADHFKTGYSKSCGCMAGRKIEC